MRVFRAVLILVWGLCPAFVMAAEPLHLTLQKSMLLASKVNAQVFAANERVRQALAEIGANRSALLPQITGTLGGQRQTEDLRSLGINLPGDPHVGPFNSFDTRARLTMQIFDPSAMERLQSAKAGKALSEMEFHKVRQDILALVGTMFLEGRRASQAVLLNKINLQKSKYQYKIAEARFKKGLGSVSEVDHARTNLAQAQYLFKSAQTQAEKARMDLASALGIPLDQEIIFDEDSNWLKQDIQASDSNADIAVAQAHVNQSKTALNEARADFLPKLTASGDYGRSGGSPSASSNTYSLGMAVTLPLWEGGLRQARLEETKSKLKESEALFKDARSQNQAKIKEAENSLEEAKAYLTAKIQQMNYMQHQWLIAVNQLKSGVASRLQMYEANAAKALSIDEYNEALALYWTARINLIHTRGHMEDLIGLNSRNER